MKLDSNKWKALVGTILFHALLLLALLFLALKTPLPLPAEQGVEVSIGTGNTGSGSQIHTAKPAQSQPKKEQKKKTVVTPPPTKKEPQKDLTQNVEKAPSLPKKQPVKKNPVPVKKKKKLIHKRVKKNPAVEKKKSKPIVKIHKAEKPKPVINQRALFHLSTKQNNKGHGMDSVSNEMGRPHGIEQSTSFMGKGGKRNGISYSLGGRGARYIDKPHASFNEQGSVVVQIWVNPAGKVVQAQINNHGTTVVDEHLRNLAIQSALNSTFVSDPSAPSKQTGTITYTFILKK